MGLTYLQLVISLVVTQLKSLICTLFCFFVIVVVIIFDDCSFGCRPERRQVRDQTAEPTLKHPQSIQPTQSAKQALQSSELAPQPENPELTDRRRLGDWLLSRARVRRGRCAPVGPGLLARAPGCGGHGMAGLVSRLARALSAAQLVAG